MTRPGRPGPGGVLARMRAVRHANEAGAVALIVALLAPALFVFAAFAVDVARWYVAGEKAQKAADAAALAGAVYMPDDFDQAQTVARAVAVRNGFTSGVTVERTAVRTQLRVTVAAQVSNTFARVIGIDTTTITRTAVGEFTVPSPMGSPCWSFGNEPDTLGQSRPSNCPAHPQFWSSIYGPQTTKVQGDQYMTRTCAGGESGCSGSTNDDFRDEGTNGYFYLLRFPSNSTLTRITLQAYDPAFVDAGATCQTLPATWPRENMNPFSRTLPSGASNASARYKQNETVPATSGTAPYCTGDGFTDGSDQTPAANSLRNTVTSFAVRYPVDSRDPVQAPVISSCSRQFRGWSGLNAAAFRTMLDSTATPATAAQELSQATNRYQPTLASVFHQWVSLCDVTPPSGQTYLRGDYYIQVRTNVPWGTSVTTAGDTGAQGGYGRNSYALRAQVQGGGSADQVSIASLERMPIFANAAQASQTFNLIRVLPTAVGKPIKFTFFDIGDASSGATLQVLPPLDGSGTGISTAVGNERLANCTASGYRNYTAAQMTSSCRITGIQNSAGWNGKSETIVIPVPNDYTCNSTVPSGCWFRVRVSFPGATSVTDFTTWTATIGGSLVRLVE